MGDVHDLTPAYALDALDEDDRAAYEAHLATCERCREELASFGDAVAALAYAVPAPSPPPELRERIVAAARAEASSNNVVRLRPRHRATAAVGAVAAVAAVVALAVGAWTQTLRDQLERERGVVRVLADPRATSVPLQGATGRLVVGGTGDAALVVAGIPRAPAGRTYEIWVIDRETPRPAGLFAGGEPRNVVRLTRPVPTGATVAVTIERAGGVDAPTSPPLFSAGT